jgi:hypothetical protein
LTHTGLVLWEGAFLGVFDTREGQSAKVGPVYMALWVWSE